jgi:phenylacetate-CoA ligase
MFERDIMMSEPQGTTDAKPAWLNDFVTRTCGQVPYFNSYAWPADHFEDLPTTSRANLSTDITRFVPDSVSLERMMIFSTSGTTGHPLIVPSHPVVAGRYLAFHLRALKRAGVELTHGAGQVGVILLGFQRNCFTYISVNPSRGESGLAKINLHPSDWRHPDDRAAYLNAMAPEIYSGDPLSFAELLTLPITAKPRALLSVSMHLSEGLRQQLQDRFSCPVLDIYSLNEAGPVAVYDSQLDGYVLLQSMLYVEVLDDKGVPVKNAERGEITLTGGFNFCLPLLRYRTGDHARLDVNDNTVILRDLVGRRPVRYRLPSGAWINNIDITHALTELAIPRFGLHQHTDGQFTLKLTSRAMQHAKRAQTILQSLLGIPRVNIEEIKVNDKIIQYTSDLDGD